MLVLFLYFFVVDLIFFSISFSIQSCDRLVTHQLEDITQYWYFQFATFDFFFHVIVNSETNFKINAF